MTGQWARVDHKIGKSRATLVVGLPRGIMVMMDRSADGVICGVGEVPVDELEGACVLRVVREQIGEVARSGVGTAAWGYSYWLRSRVGTVCLLKNTR